MYFTRFQYAIAATPLLNITLYPSLIIKKWFHKASNVVWEVSFTPNAIFNETQGSYIMIVFGLCTALIRTNLYCEHNRSLVSCILYVCFLIVTFVTGSFTIYFMAASMAVVFASF